MNVTHDETAERHYIESVLCDKLVLNEHPVSRDDFYSPIHREVIDAMTAIVDEGGTPDIPTLGLKLPGAIGVISKFEPVTAANAAFYARAIREAASKRRLYAMAAEVMEATGRHDLSSHDIAELAEKTFTSLYERHEGRAIELRDAVHGAIDLLQRRYEAKGALTGIPTGFEFLDRDLDGLQDGSLTVIGARPSIGKTAFAIGLALKAAETGFSVGFFSAEMPTPMIILRMLASKARLQLQAVRHGLMTSTDFSRAFDAGGVLANYRMLIDDSPNPTLSYLKGKARWMKRHGVQVIFIDYLTLISHGDPRTPRHERVGEVSKSLKNLARELGVPVIVLSQLNRTVEGERPSLDSLRQSGEIEEDADVVLLLHRERDIEQEASCVEAEVIIAKNRNGPTGPHKVAFIPKSATFEEVIK